MPAYMALWVLLYTIMQFNKINIILLYLSLSSLSWRSRSSSLPSNTVSRFGESIPVLESRRPMMSARSGESIPVLESRRPMMSEALN